MTKLVKHSLDDVERFPVLADREVLELLVLVARDRRIDAENVDSARLGRIDA